MPGSQKRSEASRRRLSGLGTLLLAAGLSVTLTGCVDDILEEEESSSGTSYRFVDAAPVEGLEYRVNSGESTGVTGSDGSVECDNLDAISFWVGDIEIGSTTCGDSSEITTLDFSYSIYDDIGSYTELGNQTQFLQSLDDDGYIDNGIQIASGVSELAANRNVDFYSSSFETDYSSLVNELTTATSAGARDLIPRSTALDNLRTSMSSLGYGDSSSGGSAGGGTDYSSYDNAYCAADYPQQSCSYLDDSYEGNTDTSFLGEGSSCPSDTQYLMDYDCSSSGTFDSCGACVITQNY